MNTRHKSLKFTFDFEQNDSLPFLDVKITRGSKGFSTLLFFAKPRLAEFSRTLIVSFLSIIKQVLFSHYCFPVSQFAQICSLEVDQLRHIFKCNNCPVTLIDQCVKTFLNKIFVPERTLITFPKKDILIVLPF